MSARVIAIDGPAGSGKSSVARALAAALGWSFLDTGAMYRAVTVEALHTGVDVHDGAAMGELARSVQLTTLPRISVNGRDVEDEIRTDTVNEAVSIVAANALVRRQMVRRQREFADAQPLGTVVEGRDITTVVFPNATLKVFLTASLEERARRRGEEGAASVARRDVADSTRVASPLRQAHDALVLDTTGRQVDEAVKEIIQWLKKQTLS
ncbi:MAG TPA: (d)CMP kinase [Acidimicrobiales bacterium]|nr:(d)CMP kinase [Acidimicrobiales bacterium]